MINVFLISVSGIFHAFDADHVVAVSGIVSERKKLLYAVKDGIFWGLGHSLTIFVAGILIFTLKLSISETVFSYFECLVGLMLMGLGAVRLYFFYKPSATKSHPVLAFPVGMIHGLAGSGAFFLAAISQTATLQEFIGYTALFALGTIAGMVFAASICYLPSARYSPGNLSKRISLFSGIICLSYGGYFLINTLFEMYN